MAGWTTVKVPQSVAQEIRKLARKKNKPQWQIILDALAFYKERYSNGFGEKASNLEKISYYIMKLSKSVAWFQKDPTKENLDMLRKTAEQISQRLGVNTEIVIKTAEAFYKTRAKEDYVELNMALKMVIADLISLIGIGKS